VDIEQMDELLRNHGGFVLIRPGIEFECPGCHLSIIVEEYCAGTEHEFGYFCERCSATERFWKRSPCDCSETKYRVSISLVEVGPSQERFWIAQSIDRPEVKVVSKSRVRTIEDVRLLLRHGNPDFSRLDGGFVVRTDIISVRTDPV
jgi:hypothetical protein